MTHVRDELTTRRALGAALATTVLVPVGAHGAVGQIDFAYGDVVGVDPAGTERRLARGAEINEGDTVVTRRGRAQIRFSDGARTSLLPNSEFRVDKYEYQAEAEEESTGFFSLLRGGLRTITGAIGRIRKEAYQVTTPSATIGIRGTEYLAVIGNSLSVWVGDGEIEACNNAGCTSFEGGESGYVADEDTKAIHTDGKPDTSGGDVDGGEYSASEDVDEDGTPDVVEDEVTPPDDDDEVLTFADGAFYALAVAVGDGGEGAIAASGSFAPGDLVDGTFTDDKLTSYASASLNGDIGTAQFFEADGDGIVGWGRWSNGVIDTDAFGGLTSLNQTPSESHHYAVGVPTSDMPTTGTATYSLLGATRPTSATSFGGGAIGDVNSASLDVDFGVGTVGVNIDFDHDGDNYVVDSGPISIGSGTLRHRFSDSGSFTTGSACSGACTTYIEGFFAGDGASRAGLVYEVVGPEKISGAAAFQRDGSGGGSE